MHSTTHKAMPGMLLIAAALTTAFLSAPALADPATDAPPAATEAAAATAGDAAATPAAPDAGADAADGGAYAPPPPPPKLPTRTGLHLALTAGLSFGGDTLAQATFTNGDTEKLKAGGLFYFAAGPSLEFADSPWSVQALFGRHMDSVTATNGELSFERNTMELQVFHRTGAHRLGLGYVKHLSPEYQQSGDVVFPLTVGFKDATGLSLEYNWMPVGSKVGISARAVKIDYESESANGIPVVPDTFSGNHMAVGVYLYL